MAIVYKHIRLDINEVFYIGIGKTNKRVTSLSARNKHWHNIVNKAGFKAEIVENNLAWENACEREKYWIKHYGRKDLNEGTLVNMTDGGNGICGQIFTDETKQKMSKSSFGKLYMTGKTYEEMYGKEKAEELKKKRSDNLKKNNPAKLNHVRQQLIERNKIDNPSKRPEIRERLSKIRSGRTPWNKGITGTKYHVK